MTFDWSLNIGHVLIFGSILLSVGIYRQRMIDMEKDIKEIKDDMKAAITSDYGLSTTLATQALQIKAHDSEIDRLRSKCHDLSNALQTMMRKGGGL